MNANLSIVQFVLIMKGFMDAAECLKSVSRVSFDEVVVGERFLVTVIQNVDQSSTSSNLNLWRRFLLCASTHSHFYLYTL